VLAGDGSVQPERQRRSGAGPDVFQRGDQQHGMQVAAGIANRLQHRGAGRRMPDVGGCDRGFHPGGCAGYRASVPHGVRGDAGGVWRHQRDRGRQHLARRASFQRVLHSARMDGGRNGKLRGVHGHRLRVEGHAKRIELGKKVGERARSSPGALNIAIFQPRGLGRQKQERKIKRAPNTRFDALCFFRFFVIRQPPASWRVYRLF